MNRLVDAEVAKEVLKRLLYETALNNSGGASLICEDIAENRLDAWMDQVATISVVQVVGCEDCRFFEDEDEDGDCWCYCHNDITCRDGYCSWGERREDDSK